MALTSDEEARVRALLAAVRKLPGPPSVAKSIDDEKTRIAVGRLEQFLIQLANRLNV